MSMLKTTMSSLVFAANKVQVASVLVANEISDVKDGGRSKPIKLKTRRSESQKLSKSKKPSKSGNSSEFATKRDRPNFLTPNARTVFNRLLLVFIEASIL